MRGHCGVTADTGEPADAAEPAGDDGASPAFAHPSEAQFARVLDFYGVAWQYEPRTFPLREEDGRIVEAFSPDFYLPDFNLFVELTTLKQSLVTYKNRKLRLLRERYPDVRIKLLYRRDYLGFLARFGIDPRHSAGIPPVERVLIRESELRQRVEELGAQITRDYAGSRPVLVGVLRGVACFMADLMRAISLPVTVDFLALSPYNDDADAELRFTKDLDENIAGQRVLVVEDVVDTGISLHRLLRYLHEREPLDVRVCALLDKRRRRLTETPIEYVGFEIGDEFVVGYGLDYRQEYRNLPYIGVVQPSQSL